MLSNLRWASRSVVHSGRASFLLHKDSFPLLPAARRLGQFSLCCLLSSHRLGQLPLLPIVIGCGRTADVENNAPKTNLSYSSEAIIHSAASQALIWVLFIAVVQEVMRLITETHCIWFLSEPSSSLGTCRWRGRGWRGSGSTVASRTPYGRSLGSGLPGGQSGWWSDRFSLYIWGKERGSREGCRDIVSQWLHFYLWEQCIIKLSVIHQRAPQWTMIACAVMVWKWAFLGELALIQIVWLMRAIKESAVWRRVNPAISRLMAKARKGELICWQRSRTNLICNLMWLLWSLTELEWLLKHSDTN